MVGFGVCAPPPHCSIVGVESQESRCTIGATETLNIVKFLDDAVMQVDKILLEYCTPCPMLHVAVKFHHAVGTVEAAPLLQEWGLVAVAPCVPIDTYPFDCFLKVNVNG